MSILLRDFHYVQFCDALAEVAATAPTLCEGWDAHELAVHIWVIKHDPLSWPGIPLSSFAGLTRRRAKNFRQRWPYEELLKKLRRESGAIASLPFDGRQGHRHALGEFYIHTEDVRRANNFPRSTQTSETEAALWLRTREAGRYLWPRNQAAICFNSPGQESFTVGRGAPVTQVSGLPSEVFLWLYGRNEVADVDVSNM